MLGSPNHVPQALLAQNILKKAPHNPANLVAVLHSYLHVALYRSFSYPQDYFKRAHVKGETFAEAGFYMAGDMQSLVCYFCDLEITSLVEWKQLNLNDMLLKHRTLSPACALASAQCNNVPMGDLSQFRNYKFEAHRLFSLLRSEVQHLWVNVDPYDLARWGFYYAGMNDDNVRCSFCYLEVRGWEKGDTAEGEHKRWNQNCSFLKQSSSFVGNVKIGEELHQAGVSFDSIGNLPSKASTIQRKYPTLKARKNAIILSESSLGINEMTPAKHTKFATSSERLKSFAKLWPKSMTQRPQQLAEAGFFYTGIGDRVLCFHCGLGLKDWVSNDNVWEQHVKWSPSCPFLLMAKGTSFVSQKLQGSTETEFISAMEVDGVAKATNNVSESLACQKCIGKNCCVSLPCGHMSVCTNCFDKNENCAKCGKFVLAAVDVFLN